VESVGRKHCSAGDSFSWRKGGAAGEARERNGGFFGEIRGPKKRAFAGVEILDRVGDIMMKEDSDV
jgi:hypothetical protein